MLSRERLDSDSIPRSIVLANGATRPSVSPDGRWLTYAANVDGREEIHVTGYLEALGTSQVTLGGGHSPRWSGDGTELFFLARDTLWAKDVSPDGLIDTSNPRPVLSAEGATGYAVVSAGEFLLLQPNPAALMDEINVITNWPSTLLQSGR